LLTLDQLFDTVTIPEAAERLAVTQKTIRNWADRGLINRVNEAPMRPVYLMGDIAEVHLTMQRKHASRGRLTPA
jgi:predicted site-specific integrase-resolvase